MMKNKLIERLMRLLITLLGAGIGAAIAALLLPMLSRMYPVLIAKPYTPMVFYVTLCALGALLAFLFSGGIIARTLQLMASFSRRWEKMPMQQIAFTAMGLLLGLIVAALISQLVLSMGASLITISVSALIYLVLGTIGMQVGYRRYREGKKHLSSAHRRMAEAHQNLLAEDALLGEERHALQGAGPASPCKVLDTSVIIDGRVLDIVATGFLEGDIVVPAFVLAELRHIADSGDDMRRARGRRGLDVLTKLQEELKHPITIDDTDYEDTAEVDVKLLRLCRDRDGVVVTNDYNLNKVAGVSGIRVLNINDLANAVKPMLMAGEEMTVQVVREGKEPGQGVAYLDDGTMIVIDGGRRHVGEAVPVVVTTVLQTSAGRMIFTKLKTADEKVG